VPESRRRKKKPSRRYVAPAPAGPGAPTAHRGDHKKAVRAESPRWFGGLLLALFAIGIAWLLTYYFSNGTALGMSHLGGWNIVVGFGFILGGLGAATQWK
jgi:hypothetical protein